MALLGLDIGTTGCKASIVELDGSIQASAYEEYAPICPRQDWFELDPEQVWEKVCMVIRRCTAQCKTPVLAMSVSSFGETMIPVGSKGDPVANSILYYDLRGQDQIKMLEEKIGAQRILEICGANPHPMYGIAKVLWIKQNQPERFAKVWKFFFYADYVLFRLGAMPHTDYSLAARSLAFDVVHKEWSEEILNVAGVSPSLFGDPVCGGTMVGRINPDLAMHLGLPKDVMLVSGGQDQPCAALGAGVLQQGVAVDGMGTVECITPVFDRPVISQQMARHHFVCVPHVVPDQYVTFAFNLTSGSSLKWYRDTFCQEEKRLAQQSGRDVYDIILEDLPQAPSELLFLPYMKGCATPFMDTAATGALMGLRIDTTRRQILKGILEGLAFEMVHNLDCLTQAGIFVQQLRAVGGMSRSEKILQLKADIMGLPIQALDVEEAGTLGVAMLAGKAAGVYPTLAAAEKQLIRVKKTFHPDPDKQDFYQERYTQYRKIYPATRQIFQAP